MFYANRRRIRHQLEAELQKHPCAERLRWLADQFPVFRRFNGGQEICRFLLDHSVAEHTKDDLLCALIQSLRCEGASEFNTVLILAFWPALCVIARRATHWDPDPDELWQNLTWAFLQAVNEVNLGDYPCRLAGRLFSATASRLRRHYRREWARRRRETPVEDEPEDLPANEVPDERAVDIVARALARINLRRIRRAYDQHRLTADEYWLFTDVDVHGTSLSEYAHDIGLAYEAAKKRHQRVRAKIKRIVTGNHQLTEKMLSPKAGDRGTSLIGR